MTVATRGRRRSCLSASVAVTRGTTCHPTVSWCYFHPLNALGLCCGQIEIPALRSCHPNSRAWLHKHHHRLDTLGKQGVTARTYPAPGTAQSVPRWEKSSAEQGEHLNTSLGLHLHIQNQWLSEEKLSHRSIMPQVLRRLGQLCVPGGAWGLCSPHPSARSGTICKNRLQLLKC